ncbi:MAG: YiiX/YebB-like N1pC/P60 family cysteine hydrolase [Prolixibacteraceae bacterium]
MKLFNILILMVSVLAGNAQNNPSDFNISLCSGDLLFCSTTSGTLSKAIDEVTQTEIETHFSHIGIIEIQNDTVWVLHSAPKKGVCRETIGKFLFPEKEKITATVYRLKNSFQNTIPEALKKAQTYLGQEYNYSYILEDEGVYCSEFIYEIFASDSIFMLNPMTFKNPETGRFIAGWTDHYQKLGIPVPEGKPGCNPNGMAASEKLERLGELKFRIRK